MADFNKDDLRQMLEDILNSGSKPSAGAPGTGGKQTKSVKELLEAYDKLGKQIKDQGSKYSVLNKMLSQNSTVAQAVNDDLKHLDEQISKTTDSAEVSMLRQKRRDIEMEASHATQKQMLFQFGQSLTKVGSTAFAGIGQFVKGLQSGGSGIDLASGIMNTGLDMAGQTSQALGNAAGQAGQVLMNSTNPKVKALGAVAAVAGPLLGQLGESASKLAKFGVEVLSKEVEKTVKAFHTASNSGAVFADGMTGLRNASNAAGLTVDQFSNILQKHSGDLAQSGLGVTEGAKTIGRVTQDLRKSGVASQLQKLGYGFEEQAELIATTTANMRRTAGGKVSDQEIATQTAKYAESLRTIAAITGEDAKRKTEEARQQNQIMAFQAELAKKTPEQRAAIDAAMATMTEQEKKNFRDRVVLGEVINKEGAIYEATIDGARQKGEAALALFNNNQLTAEANAKLNAQYGEQIKQSALNNDGLNTAAFVVGGSLAEIAKSSLDAVNQANTFTKEAVDAGTTGVQAQKNASDKLTESVTSAETAAQNLKLSLEKTLTPAIGRFAQVSKEMLAGVQKMLKDVGMGGEEEKPEDDSWWGKVKKGFTEDKWLSKGLTVGGTAATVGGAVASATGVGAIGGVPVAAVGGIMTGLGMLAEMFGYAKGGISEGSPDGYLTKLHGKELIVPFNGNTLDTSSVGYEELMKIIDRPSKSVSGMAPSSSGSSDAIDIGKQLGTMFDNVANDLAGKISKGFDTDSMDPGGIMGSVGSIVSGLSSPLSSVTQLVNKLSDDAMKGSTDSGQTASLNESALSELKGALESLVETSREQLEKHEEMIRHLSDQKDISERLLNNSY